MPHPFASRRLNFKSASIYNHTPYDANFAKIEYCDCTPDENNFIVSGGTWTVSDASKAYCKVTEIHATLILDDGSTMECGAPYLSGRIYATFTLMWGANLASCEIGYKY